MEDHCVGFKGFVNLPTHVQSNKPLVSTGIDLYKSQTQWGPDTCSVGTDCLGLVLCWCTGRGFGRFQVTGSEGVKFAYGLV